MRVQEHLQSRRVAASLRSVQLAFEVAEMIEKTA
jgi:hypothetical protein